MRTPNRNKGRRKTRQEEALERQEFYKALTPEEKIVRLDKKLGKGKGAKKQREKLTLLLK